MASPPPTLDERLLERLACPRDHEPVAADPPRLSCAGGHDYAIVDGIPIFVLEEATATHPACDDAVRRGSEPAQQDFGASDEDGPIHPFVQRMVGGTCGRMYKPLIGRLSQYPIPEIRLPASEGETLLDLGCGWGRWSIAAARKGYRPIGLDPWLEAVRAARHVTRQLGATANYVVGDARHLPFADGTFDVVFSYSVLQHFAKSDVRAVLHETRRVLKPGGSALIELPNAYGLLNAVQQVRRAFRQPRGFDVRYWRLSELKATFEEILGPTTVSADSYFFINGQPTDRTLLPARYRGLVTLSEGVRKLSQRAPFLVSVADSLYVRSTTPR